MPKFLVYVDKGEPYEVDYPSSISATIAALNNHPSAGRVDVVPRRRTRGEPVFMRRVSDTFNPTTASTVTSEGQAMFDRLKAWITPDFDKARE